MLLTRYMLLLGASTLGGGLSGFMVMKPNGFQGAALAFCLSLGTIWLAEKERRNGRSVGILDVMATGLITGTIAVIPVALLEILRSPIVDTMQEQFSPPELDVPYLIVAPILFGLFMHAAYFLRRGGRRPFLRVFSTSILVVFLLRLGLDLSLGTGRLLNLLLFFPIGFLFLVAPFPLLWLSVNRILDPAWKEPPVRHRLTSESSKSHPEVIV